MKLGKRPDFRARQKITDQKEKKEGVGGGRKVGNWRFAAGEGHYMFNPHRFAAIPTIWFVECR
jgi:hypothetical protein